MEPFKSEFLRVLQTRGFVHQISDPQGLDQLLCAETVTAYIGFDCTAPSLHVGSLLPIMMLYWLQQTGHRPLALMGSGTTRIGDPSGRDATRQILTPEIIETNKVGIRKVFDRFLTFGEGAKEAVMPDNADWLLDLNYVTFLRDYGRHISVNQMLARDSVRNRLDREQHLSFLEFNYMCFQAYDFVELNHRYGCRLQMGGSDQWGNIVSGVDLGRRTGTPELFALTCALLTTSSGAKMGKTAAGAVWLDAIHLSAYDYWQYWRNTEDADVERFLKLYTAVPLDEIAKLAQLQGAELNEAKKVLATAATAMVHGEELANLAAETARLAFEQGQSADTLPTITISASERDAGIGILTLIVKAGLATSNGEARRHIAGNAIRIDDQPVTDPRLVIGLDQLPDGQALKISMGKKRHVLVRVA